ncbi:MAG: DoxX family protein [Bacteroidota bacterium]
MKRNKIIYWVLTALFSLSILSGAIMYFFKYGEVAENFGKLGFPAWIIYPLAIAKILGVVGILQTQSQVLREWAYAGFFFNLSLACGAHIAVNDGEAFGPIMVMAFMFGSYFFSKKVTSPLTSSNNPPS